jgi:hypothetical protein
MGNPIKKVTLKALEAVRIRVNGEKVNLEAGDLIEVDESLSSYYLKNGFGFEADELKPVIEKEIEEEEKTVEEEETEEEETEKETTEITDIKDIDNRKEAQAEKAKAETKKAKAK